MPDGSRMKPSAGTPVRLANTVGVGADRGTEVHMDDVVGGSVVAVVEPADTSMADSASRPRRRGL
jgi:hypothetical protein